MIVSKLNKLMSDKHIRNMSELSRLTKLDRRTLTAIYDNTNVRIDYVTLNALCDFFKCNVGDLIEYVAES